MICIAFVSTLLIANSASLNVDAKAAATIRNLDAQWVKAAKKGVDAWDAFYAADAVVLPANEPICQTKQAIRASMAAFLALPGLDMKWHSTKIVFAKGGDMAYDLGFYRLSYKGADGKTAIDNGKYVEIWKKQRNGSWKCAVDMFNSSLPMTGS